MWYRKIEYEISSLVNRHTSTLVTAWLFVVHHRHRVLLQRHIRASIDLPLKRLTGPPTELTTYQSIILGSLVCRSSRCVDVSTLHHQILPKSLQLRTSPTVPHLDHAARSATAMSRRQPQPFEPPSYAAVQQGSFGIPAAVSKWNPSNRPAASTQHPSSSPAPPSREPAPRQRNRSYAPLSLADSSLHRPQPTQRT